MSQSKSMLLDQFPICIKPGLTIGYITDGIADLTVDWDAEQDRAYLVRVEGITLAAEVLNQNRASSRSLKLDPASEIFSLIEAEMHRLDDEGELDLEYDLSPDPDYLRDLRDGDSLYIKLQAGAM